jgi:hypothetical protein
MTKKIVALTSMSQNYYDFIGKYFLKSFNQHWKDIPLFVYSEDLIENIENENVKVIDWNPGCKERWEDFCSRSDHSSARKFAKKGFTIIDAMKNIDADYIVWLDSDLISCNSVDRSIIEKLIDDRFVLSIFDQYYLSRRDYTRDDYIKSSDREIWTAETGFFIINKSHHQINALHDEYLRLYQAKTKPEGLPRWYDCDTLIMACKNKLQYVNDLSDLKSTPKTQTPINKTWLAKYFQHFKAKSKNHISQEQMLKFIETGTM